MMSNYPTPKLLDREALSRIAGLFVVSMAEGCAEEAAEKNLTPMPDLAIREAAPNFIAALSLANYAAYLHSHGSGGDAMDVYLETCAEGYPVKPEDITVSTRPDRVATLTDLAEMLRSFRDSNGVNWLKRFEEDQNFESGCEAIKSLRASLTRFASTAVLYWHRRASETRLLEQEFNNDDA